jgi:Holliday junction resolvase
MSSKTLSTATKSVLTTSGLSSKTITDVIVTVHGSVVAIECVEAGGSHFIKVKQGVIEVGGTLDFDTGTKVSFP